MELTASFTVLLQHFVPVFTTPTFETFLQVVTGWVLLRVIKIIDSALIRIIDRISLTQRCHLIIDVPIVQGLTRL